MGRSDVGFAGSAVGAAMVVAGVLDIGGGGVFLAGGALLAAGGLATLGLRGSVALLLCGVWVASSAGIVWASARWNLLAAGLAAVALGFTVGVSGAAEA